MSKNDYFKDDECRAIADLYTKHGFPVSYRPLGLNTDTLRPRADFIREELNELYAAIKDYRVDDIVDALVDIVYVAKGTAVMMGLEWEKHFAEVQRANMEKEKGSQEKRPDLQGDLIKPKDWKGPDHYSILLRRKEKTLSSVPRNS